MAVYKVPQDVEAEDKLVGPFSFRQFVYLLIAGGAGGLTVLFFNAPIPVPFFSALTIPVVIVFLVLALPLRKDQPMEIYLAAVLRFMLKPKRRLWMNDGGTVGVVINSSSLMQQSLSKDITQEEALDRLSYLSRIVDTRGWAAKGVDLPHETSVNVAIANEAYSAEDMMDENTGLAKSFDSLIAKQKEDSRKEAMERMREFEMNRAAGQSSSASTQQQSTPAQPLQEQPATATASRPTTPAADDNTSSRLHFNPYPQMHQHVLTPLDEIRQKAAAIKPSQPPVNVDDKKAESKDMTPPVSPDIMRLANNNDLSIQAIANEARRISEQESEEVVIKLH